MADEPKEIIIPAAAASAGSAQLSQEREKLEKRIRSGADWFFWIAGASIVNTIISLFDSTWFFMAGLAFPVLVTVIASEAGLAYQVISVVVTAACAGMHIAFGVFARKRHTWAFVAGIVMYVLDGILFFIFEDWLSGAFHVFATVMIVLGLQANLKLRKLERESPVAAPDPVRPF